MKKFILCILLLASYSPLQAQYMKGEVCFDAGVGLQFPTGLLEDQVKTGSHFTLGAGIYVNSSWYLGLKVNRTSFDPKIAEIIATGLSGQKYLNVELEARLMLYPESWFTPYILAGGGWVQKRTWHNTGAAEVVNTNSKLAFVSGFGLNGHSSSSLVSLYTEVVYHHIPSEFGSDQFVRWTTGLRLSFGGRPF